MTITLALAGCATAARSPGAGGTLTAIAFDRAGQRGSLAEGFADPGARRKVTVDDPARVASVSKLVTAIGVMKLVERGRLDLDSDVSDMLGYTVAPPNHFGRAVTLRMLLSHTSGLRDHDDQYAIPLGERLEDVLRDPRSWDAVHRPDSGYFTYANLNYVVIGSVIEKATGERFDRWMRREVLEPLTIDACFNWPTCSGEAVARAVVLTQDGKVIRDDLRGRQPDCPVFVREGRACDLAQWRAGENGALFAPQGGLRISARGLARIGRMLLNGGELDGVRLLRPDSVRRLLGPVWSYNGSNGDTSGGIYCNYGLATQRIGTRALGCNDDVTGSGRRFVGHSGDAYGVRSGLWLDPVTGTGIAYIRTGLPAAPPKGRTAWPAPEEEAFRRALALSR